MDFFKRLFGDKANKKSEDSIRPDNTRLLFYIDNWWKNRSDANYKMVVKEIIEGNSYLLLPSLNDNSAANDWHVADNDITLQLTSCYNLDGLKVLGAFTDDQSLLNWAKKATVSYTSLKSKDVLSLCEKNNIGRVVINSGSDNMFVLECDNNSKGIEIKKGTEIAIGSPATPLDKNTLDNIISSFKGIETINEAYHYVQVINREPSLMIGVKLFVNSENAQKAVLNAVRNAMKDKATNQFVDVFFIDTDHWLKLITNVEGSLFYKKH